MKKITLISLIIAIMTCTIFCVPASAISLTETTQYEKEVFANGDYIETVISYEMPDNSAVRATSSSKTGTKTKSYKNSSGTLLWSVTIKGTFTYNGTTSTCTSCSHSTTSPGTYWSIKSSSSSRSGNSATAKATATHNTSTGSLDYSMSVTLTCSANGTLS